MFFSFWSNREFSWTGKIQREATCDMSAIPGYGLVLQVFLYGYPGICFFHGFAGIFFSGIFRVLET